MDTAHRDRHRDPTAPRVFAVLNPIGRDQEAARDTLESAAADAGWPEPTFLPTSRTAPGGPQAQVALREGADLVVVGGGDGTVREVAHVLSGTGVPLGILPLGTANLFAHNLGLRTRDLPLAVSRALHGTPRPVDVGVASWRPVDHGIVEAPTPEQTFLVMAGIGHDAATVLATRPEYKRRLGWLAYLAAGSRHLLSAPLAMRVSVDGLPLRRVRVWCFLAANAGNIPGGITVFPDANPDDGVLDTLEVPLTSPTQWASIAAKGLLGHGRDVPALRYGPAATLWVIPDQPAPLQLDGDVIPHVADVRVRIVPGALRVHACPE